MFENFVHVCNSQLILLKWIRPYLLACPCVTPYQCYRPCTSWFLSTLSTLHPFIFNVIVNMYVCVPPRIRIDMNNSWYKFTRYVLSILNYTVYIFAILQDKLKMYETSNVLNRSLCRIILEEKISRAFKMLQNFFDDWRKIEDNIFMWRKSFSNHSQSSTFDMYPSIM